MKYSDKDLFQLVADVESEFASLLNKAEQEQTEMNDAAELVAEGYSDSEVEELNDIYSNMTKSEAEIHYQAIKKSLFGAESEEVETQPEVKEEVFAKSEKDELVSINSNLAKENEELKKSLEEVKTHVQAFISKQVPQRKAITDISFLGKAEDNKPTLTKSDIDSKLKTKVRDQSLAKSDRDAINNYYMNNGSTDSIKHLL